MSVLCSAVSCRCNWCAALCSLCVFVCVACVACVSCVAVGLFGLMMARRVVIVLMFSLILCANVVCVLGLVYRRLCLFTVVFLLAFLRRL